MAEHIPGDAVRENVVEATETEDGSYDEVVYCTECEAEISRNPMTIPATGSGSGEGGDEPTEPVDPTTPDPAPVPAPGPGDVEIDETDVPLAEEPDDDEVELEDTDVPLTALMTRAEFVNYLYVKAGSPDTELSSFEDVAENHVYAMAIGWAQANGITKGVSATRFAPDEIVTVEQARLFLERYAAFKGIEMPELAALLGKDDEDILDNADEVLAEFFSKDQED